MPEPDRRLQFEALLSEEIYRMAWGYACRLCTAGGAIRRADAEDLLQEALLRAYQRFHQLRDAARFKGWLLSIVRRAYLDRLRRPGQPAQSLDELLDELPERTPARHHDPRAELMLVALSQLPLAPRELLSLFYLEGLNLEETGQVLGLAPRIVRQRLFRAREALKRQFAVLEAPYGINRSTPQAKEGLLP
jgi:RNA polymerase sigma-70 factor (ECF subfamily)